MMAWHSVRWRELPGEGQHTAHPPAGWWGLAWQLPFTTQTHPNLHTGTLGISVLLVTGSGQP